MKNKTRITIRGSYAFRPQFEIAQGKSRLTGCKKTVSDPKKFGGQFKKGERILLVHVDSTNPRHALSLLDKLFSESGNLKALGYAGCYGDTPNTALIKAFERRGAIEMDSPKPVRAWAKARYAGKALLNNFAREYLGKPVKRLVVVF